MRKISFLLIVSALLFSVSSCKKEKQAVADVNPDLAKLEIVLKNVSPECRDAIRPGNTQGFLDALKKVLLSDSVATSSSAGVNDKLKLFVLCDREHPVSELYVPTELVTLQINQYYNICSDSLKLKKTAEKSLRRMGEAARLENLTLIVNSAYRSYAEQKTVYDERKQQSLPCFTDDVPGTSEHQTGYAVDFLDSSENVKKWLSENAHKFGWSMTYSSETEYNPLHYRYIGEEACKFQRLWFRNSQNLMLEFISEWRKVKTEN